jgi:WD40 repeat protein
MVATGRGALLAATGGAAARATASEQVTTLAEETVKSMSMTRLKVVALIVLGSLAIGGGLAAYQAPAAAPPMVRKAGSSGPAPAGSAKAGKRRQARADVYGDPLPAGALARFGTVRMRHEAVVTNAVFTADSKTVIAVDAGVLTKPAVVFWDVASGKEVRRLMGHRAMIYAVAVSPDGKTLASGSYPDDLRLWDLASGKVIRVLPGHKHEAVPVVQELVFSPDGKTLASRGFKTICLWEVATGKKIQDIPARKSEVNCVAFSPDGKFLAWGGLGAPATLWDVKAGREIRQLKAPPPWQSVGWVAFSPDGKALAGASSYLSLWDLKTGALRRTGHPDPGVTQLAYLPDGKSLVGINGRRVCVFDAATGKLVRRFEGGERSMANLAVSPDGKTVATSWGGSPTFDLWDVASGKLRHTFQGHTHCEPVLALVLTADGKTLFSGSGIYDYALPVWEASTGRELRRFEDLTFEDFTDKDGRYEVSPGAAALALAPDGKVLAAGGRDRVVLRDPATGKPLRYLHGPKGGIRWVAFSGDGKTLAACGYLDPDKVVWVWDLPAGKPSRAIEAGPDQAGIAALSPDGKVVAIGGYADGSFRTWEAASGKEVRRVTAGTDMVLGLAFAPDGKTLATSGAGGTVSLWDLALGKRLRSFDGQQGKRGRFVFPGGGLPLAFSPNGRTLATAGWDHTVRLWEVATGWERTRYAGHRGPVRALAFSPDGSVLFSGSADTTILAWDVTGLALAGRR